MVNTWVTLDTGERVMVTGVSGDQFRIFRGGNNMRYDWVNKDEVAKEK